jgi:hypothetical protein
MHESAANELDHTVYEGTAIPAIFIFCDVAIDAKLKTKTTR